MTNRTHDVSVVRPEDDLMRSLVREAGTAACAGAKVDIVNRTRRVVQERARTIATRRSKIKSLWAPVFIFSLLLIGICVAVWTVLDEYELAASGTQVASYKVLVPFFWSIPVSAALLAIIWFRKRALPGGDRYR